MFDMYDGKYLCLHRKFATTGGELREGYTRKQLDCFHPSTITDTLLGVSKDPEKSWGPIKSDWWDYYRHTRCFFDRNKLNVGDSVWLLTVRYDYDGDFGITHNCYHDVGFFDSEEEAIKQRQSILDRTYKDPDGGKNFWTGGFDVRFNDVVEIHPMVLS